MTAVHLQHEIDYLSDYRQTENDYRAGNLTGERLQQWREERATDVIAYVRRNSPFYRSALDSVTRWDPTHVPFTTKEQLREAGHSVLSQPVSAAAAFYETTGTTGPSTPCPRSPLDNATSNASVAASWKASIERFFPDHKPVVALLGPSELYAFGDVFTAVASEVGVAQVKLWPESPRVGYAKALQLMHDLQVEVAVCSPALCLQLARAAEELGVDRETIPLKLFLVLGEVSTPAFAKNVSTLWPDAAVVPALYGSQESLCIAAGCPSGELHLAELNYLFEIIDPDSGHVLPPGRVGELVLTMLAPGAKPLIRYRTGDIVEITDTCRCGHPGRVVQVLGRRQDLVPINGTSWWPSELEQAVLSEVSQCTSYQIQLDTTPDGTDIVRVSLEVLDTSTLDVPAVSSHLTTVLGAPTQVITTRTLGAVTNTGSYVSWKAARIEDRRVPEDDLKRVARSVAHRYAITR